MQIVAIGGSDAGISAALRARELDPGVEVTVVVADAYPNYSICGIPYYFSGDVRPWQSLAHRTHADLEATGMRLRLNTLATRIDVAERQLSVRDEHGESLIDYDELIVGTGALPAYAGISGLDRLGPDDGVHVIHSMGDTFALDTHLAERDPRNAIIIGAGYVGLEMAEGFTARGIAVTQLQRGPEVLSTLDPELASLVHDELVYHGVTVHTNTVVRAVEKNEAGGLLVHAEREGEAVVYAADLVLAVVGVRPNTSLLERAGASLGAGRAVVVDEMMRTGVPHVFAAGDGVLTHHRLLGTTYLPLGTTAHKQGRIAGENALGGSARFAGSVGTQVVKVFDVVAARTGLRDHDALPAGYSPATTQSVGDDHKRYYPGAQPITIRITGDAATGLLLGAQLVGRLGTETAKRVDTYATALFAGLTVDQISDLDLSYTPPLGSPWDAVQAATQAWSRAHLPLGAHA